MKYFILSCIFSTVSTGTVVAIAIMRASQISLVWTIFVIVIQPCYDMTGSYPNRRIGGVREQVQLVTGEEVSLRNDSTTNLESFWPIRIKLYYSLGEHLDENEQDSLKQVIVRAVERVQRILSGEGMKCNFDINVYTMGLGNFFTAFFLSSFL